VAKLSQVIQIDEAKIQDSGASWRSGRSTVEETLSAMLDAEADRLCRAARYERTEARKDTRAGSYERHLQTKAGEVTLEGPKLRAAIETAIIERYRREKAQWKKRWWRCILPDGAWGESNTSPKLCGVRVSPSTVSELNQKICAKIETWCNRPIEGNHLMCLWMAWG
jgi:putative transposase